MAAAAASVSASTVEGVTADVKFDAVSQLGRPLVRCLGPASRACLANLVVDQRSIVSVELPTLYSLIVGESGVTR